MGQRYHEYSALLFHLENGLKNVNWRKFSILSKEREYGICNMKNIKKGIKF